MAVAVVGANTTPSMTPMSVSESTDMNPTSPLEGTTPSSSGHVSKRRKIGSASSRGVASLTPDQLAKKRANDREAQRAIRERTKAQIETLERRIHDLTSQQPYQELQAVIRQKKQYRLKMMIFEGGWNLFYPSYNP